MVPMQDSPAPNAPCPPHELRKVYVELTTACNLDCGMCIRHSWEDLGGDMTRETFSRFDRRVAGDPSAEVVNFSGFGEPTLIPISSRFWARLSERDFGLRWSPTGFHSARTRPKS